MVKVKCDPFDVPKIGKELEKIISDLNKPDDYCLSLQLDYRDNNTLFFLDKVSQIEFKKDMLKIKQKNNSTAFLSYHNILEYCVINASEVINLGEDI